MKKTKRIIAFTLTVISILSMFTTIISAIEPAAVRTNSEKDYTIYLTQTDALAYAKGLYGSYSNVAASVTSYSTPLQTNNYAQSILNNNYNYPNGSFIGTTLYVSGTCVQVAMAIQTQYMLNAGKFTPVSATPAMDSINAIFARAIECSDAEEGWTRTGGTPDSLCLPIINRNFTYYSPTYKGDKSTLLMKSKMQKSYEAGVPFFVELSNHEAVGVGLMCITVSYTKSGIFGIQTNHNEDIWFVTVNDGHHNSADESERTFSYVLLDDIVDIIVPET